MDYQTLFMLGRQPALGRAELESILGSDHISVLADQIVASDLSPESINFARLGGSIRLAVVIDEIQTTQWANISGFIIKKAPELTKDMQGGKIKLGISTFGLVVSPRQLLATGLEIKKSLKKSDKSVRVVPNEGNELSSAQVIHNQLTTNLGLEILLVKNGSKTWLARTKEIQDINAYAARDQNRPKRDARVGMLPPKLAQIIINLATDQDSGQHLTVLDPFCGTGVILQEALLMGHSVYGTDIEPRMIDFSKVNLNWLKDRHQSITQDIKLETGDATNYQWDHPFSCVASEAYLGRPLSNWPSREKLQQIISDCNTIIEKFLLNLSKQTPKGQRLCIAVPAWLEPSSNANSSKQRVISLPLLDHIEKIGYNRIKFEYVRNPELIYYRPDQLVARELLVLKRI